MFQERLSPVAASGVCFKKFNPCLSVLTVVCDSGIDVPTNHKKTTMVPDLRRFLIQGYSRATRNG